MCNEEKKCEKPENLKTKPEECTPEQIDECHGDVEEHPSATRGRAQVTVEQ